MKALLDTHTFLWWNMNDPQLSSKAFEIMVNGRNQIYLSAASVWEIVIKTAKGRLILPDTPATWVPQSMEKNHFSGLPIEISHSLEVYNLPDYHSDPFDRLLAAQCRVEKIPLLSADSAFREYGIDVLW
ncbi:MAG: type II toxin-antitoxin system VapC family toxin [Anaerolineales bacterium]|nr:type II toxin-antitoxin system VapC family toxin [Anaerolineales bacterium]